MTQNINARKETKTQNNKGQDGKGYTDTHDHGALGAVATSHNEESVGIRGCENKK